MDHSMVSVLPAQIQLPENSTLEALFSAHCVLCPYHKTASKIAGIVGAMECLTTNVREMLENRNIDMLAANLPKSLSLGKMRWQMTVGHIANIGRFVVEDNA